MKKFFLPIIALLAFASCTKVIDVNLNSVAPQYVIEGALMEGTQDFKVRITKTGDYFNSTKPTPIINATVGLKKSNGTAIALKHESDGVYKTLAYNAVSNTEYTLTVTIEGKAFEATSFMPQAVALDKVDNEILPEQNRDTDFKADTFQINCYFKDPPKVANYYRVKTVVSGVAKDKGGDLFVVEDRLSDGLDIALPIFTSIFKLNDKVEVELLSIDRKMFDYFNTLNNLVGSNGDGAAPANPLTNWSGGALGYFGAFSSSKKTIVVQ
jgi:Domain of unknown function (DUF4249)